METFLNEEKKLLETRLSAYLTESLSIEKAETTVLEAALRSLGALNSSEIASKNERQVAASPCTQEHLDALEALSKFEKVKAYALFGGKMLRGALLVHLYERLAACAKKKDLDVSGQSLALDFAAALELVQAYSLVHDDLPAMDNDLMRRGKPSVHAAFGESTAILVGDDLLNEAYNRLFRAITEATEEGLDPRGALKAASYFARSCGAQGMIGGQVADLWLEREVKDARLPDLLLMEIKKTARLMACAFVVPGYLCQLEPAWIEDLEHLGLILGLAFQVQDDLLDISGDPVLVGKTLGKDELSDKKTVPSILGIKAAQDFVDTSFERAFESLNLWAQRGLDTETLEAWLKLLKARQA